MPKLETAVEDRGDRRGWHRLPLFGVRDSKGTFFSGPARSLGQRFSDRGLFFPPPSRDPCPQSRIPCLVSRTPAPLPHAGWLSPHPSFPPFGIADSQRPESDAPVTTCAHGPFSLGWRRDAVQSLRPALQDGSPFGIADSQPRESAPARELKQGSDKFGPEYVNIFGVPFTFLPHEGGVETAQEPLHRPIPVFADSEKRDYEITWPNIIRVDHEYRPQLTLDLKKVKVLELDAFKTVTLAEMAPLVEGRPDVTRLIEINLQELAKRFRAQRIVFETARDVYDQMKPNWKGNREYLLAQKKNHSQNGTDCGYLLSYR